MISAVAIRIQIIFLIIYIHVKGQYQCVEGCKSCVDINSNKKQNQCTQCFEDYELNSNNNLCIYTKCESGLFYDKDYHSDAVQDNNCVAICGPLSWRNQQASLCQSQLKCSTQFSSKQSMFQGEKIQDFFVYRNDYYVAQSNYLSIYDKNDLYFIKALQLLENDLNVFHVNGVIFVTSSDNVISIWDLKRESRISKKIDSQLMTEPFRFPDLSHNNSITKFNALQLMVLSYYPSLIVSVNRNGQINFFDTADLSNCKLKKQIWPNQNINFITKFYNNKLIASSQNLVWIIDIFTQNVIKFFGSEYLLYATNSDQLVLVANECLRVYSSELLMKYENCQVLKNLTSNQSINLNNDLRVLLTDRGSDQQHLSFFTYQIDLIQQTFILTNTLKALDCYSFQIIKKFSSLQDEVNNNFSIQQIVIFDQNGNLKIYDMTLSLIYKKDSIKISNVNLINRVFNDDNAYILIGDVQLLLINTSTSNYNLIQLDFNATNQISIFETEKRINLYGKSYYYVKLFINNQIYEYQIDNQKNITYVSSLIQFKDSTINSYQLQNIKNSINAAVNYFEGGTTGLLYTSLTLKQRYSQIQATPLQSGVYNLFQNYRLGILYILHDYCYASIFDMFTSKQQQTIYNCLNINSRYLIIKDAAVIVNFTNKSKKLQINLIDFSQKITTVSYENTSDLINGFNYDENENLIYSYGKSLQLFNYQLQLVNVIDSGYFKQCYSAKQKLICLEKVTIPQQQPLFRILMYDKNSKNIQKFDLVQQKDQSQNIMIDEQQENIYFLGSNICKINSFNGSLKQQFDKNFNSCQIYSNIVVCDSSNYLIIIDRFSLTLTELGFPLENSTIQRYTYIDFLNYILFQISASPYQVSVLDVAAKKIINSFSSVLSQNQSVKPNIVNFQLDYTSSNCVLYLDSVGTFYLFSLDIQSPYQNYIKITEITDEKEKVSNFYYNNITNDIFIYGKKAYLLDYSILGWQYEPQLKEAYNLFTKIQINSNQIDYLIFNRYNNTLFRYSNKNIKFEFDINGSQIQDMQYNQSSDVLLIGLQDSLLIYQQYQFSKNNLLLPNIIKLDSIQFQQFITESLIITCDQKILHLNIQTGQIINTIQFNQTQLVTSYSLNKNQDLVVVGFSNGQVLQYNITNQTYFIFDNSKNDPLSSSITSIQFIENSNTEQLAFAISSGANLLQIDVVNKKVIQQIDLKIIVKEDPNVALARFLIDQTFQRYIFSFIGQKKAYVWNFSQQKQEQFIFLPSIKISNMKIEQNFIFIQSGFQINVYSLGTTIQFLTVIKKNLIQDRIIDFKLIQNNIIAIFFMDKFEILLIDGANINMISQQKYTYPRILDYHFDQKTNTLKILGLHKTGIFENDYNFDIILQDSTTVCNLLVSNQELEFTKQQMIQILPKQTQIQTINGISIVDQQNLQNNIYLQIPGENLQNIIQYTSQLTNKHFVISSNSIQNSIIPLEQNTFSNLTFSIFQLSNFTLDFQNNSNLIINLTENPNTKQIIFQNITIHFQCFGNNKIIIQNIEKVVFQNIKISQLQLNSCSDKNQQNPLLYFYNVSQIFIYGLEISNNNFYQISKIPIFQFEKCDQIYHSNYAFKETVEIQEPSSIEGDIFMIGLLLVETFLKRPLTPQEKIDINRQNIFSVFPDLKSSKHIQFIKKIISPMIDPSKQVRIEPAELIQNLKEFHINEEQLKQLKLQQRHRKFQTSHIEDILKGIHYDILIINLVWNDFIADGPKQIGLSLEKCHNISQLSLNLAQYLLNQYFYLMQLLIRLKQIK
ncbi:hypothetical protein ABPG73_016854 [Tetrahymena malaccensis]